MAVKTFTQAEQLTAADTNAYLNNGGLVYITEQTVGSAVTSVTVSNCFSATYNHYKIIYSGGTASTTTDLAVRMGSTSTGYYMAMIYKDFGAGAVTGQSVNNGAQWTNAGCLDTPNHLAFELFNPFATAKTVFSANYVGTGTNRVGGTTNGFLNDSTSYTSFTINAVAGNITGGVIRVYGYRQA